MVDILIKINIFIWSMTIIFSFILFLLYKYDRDIIGHFGEYWVRKELNNLNKHKYKVINDVLIENKNKTTQIDHIVISEFGIFVIETKQINYYIKGNEYDKYWTQYIGKNKNFFYNPIYQNYGHIKFLEEKLNIDYSKFISIICISSKAKYSINSDKVVHIYELVDKIKSYTDKKIDDVDEIFNKINEFNIKSKKQRKLHIKNLENKYQKNNK